MLYSPEFEKYLTDRGNYRINKITYYKKNCPLCGRLALVKRRVKYCTIECFNDNVQKKKRLGPLKGKARYERFKSLEKYEEIRKTDNGFIEVKCVYCDRWFIPGRKAAADRLYAIEGEKYSIGTEFRFYCNIQCKKNCPLYRKRISSLMKKENTKKRELSREVQSELRKLVFKRDNWKCIKCGKMEDLHCHHVEGIMKNPIESADIDNCITVCSTCHKEIHSSNGCKYSQLSCKYSETIKEKIN